MKEPEGGTQQGRFGLRTRRSSGTQTPDAGIAAHPNPPMTRYLLEKTGVFGAQDPIIIIDVGSRGGFNSEWRLFGSEAKIFGFEPDQEECDRLNALAPPGVTYIPCALGAANGTAILYQTKLAASSGLYRTNMEYFGRLLNRDNGVTVAEKEISVRTLASVLSERGIRTIDFMKLDAEGAEFDILNGSVDYVRDASLLGLLSEIRFHEEINGSPVFSTLDIFLRDLGLRLYGLQYFHQSRRALPYPGLGDFRLPTGERFFAYTTAGQIQDGDALYFRDLLVTANRGILSAMTPSRLLKLAVFYELYRLSDCAAELILARREEIGSLVDCDRLLDLLASGIRGSAISYREYLAGYFTPASPLSRRLIKPLRSLRRALRGRKR